MKTKGLYLFAFGIIVLIVGFVLGLASMFFSIADEGTIHIILTVVLILVVGWALGTLLFDLKSYVLIIPLAIGLFIGSCYIYFVVFNRDASLLNPNIIWIITAGISVNTSLVYLFKKWNFKRKNKEVDSITE